MADELAAEGVERCNLGEFEAAANCFEGAARLDPSEPKYLVQAAAMASKVGRAEDSRIMLRRALTMNLSDELAAHVRSKLAEVQRELGLSEDSTQSAAAALFARLRAAAAVEGWLQKRGSDFPHAYHPRYCVLIAETRTLYYFSAGRFGADVDSEHLRSAPALLRGELVLSGILGCGPAAGPRAQALAATGKARDEFTLEVASVRMLGGRKVSESPGKGSQSDLLARAFPVNSA